MPLLLIIGIPLALTIAGLLGFGQAQTRTHTAMRDRAEAEPTGGHAR